MRRVLVLLHRWVALAAGLLLALLGLTGSLMVWQAELDAALNPAWFSAGDAPADEPGSVCAAAERPLAETLAVLRRSAPSAQAALVLAPARTGAAYQVWERRDPATGLRREHFIDPDCAHYLGARDRGAWRLDRQHFVPLLYELHSKLLAGETGHLVAGGGALVLLGLAVSGMWLAWPAQFTWQAWRRVLTIKAGASPQRWSLDMHRAAGMWLAPVCLLLTATGAALVFDASARAAVAALLPVQTLPRLGAAPGKAPAVAPARPPQASPLAPDELVALALQRFPQANWSRLTLPTAKEGIAEVRLLQPGEPRADTGSTRVRLDSAGRIVAVHDPLRTVAGSTLLDWVFPLHSGEALGLAARLLWTLFGITPALLLGSGIWLWWRRTRQRAAAPLRPPLPAPLSAERPPEERQPDSPNLTLEKERIP